MLDFNLSCLSRYWGVFNGRRILYVVVDKDSFTVDQTQNLLEKYGFVGEIMPRDNIAPFSDSSYFLEKLSAVQSLDPEEITFYAHAKGVSADVLERRHTTIQILSTWIETMYRLNLEDIPNIEELLRKHPCVGTFKHCGDDSMATPWYYAGTFYWYNHQAVYSENWEKTTGTRFAAEEYLGNLFPIERAHCLGGTNYEKPGNMYLETCAGLNV
jgi:hypothetical protein